MMASSVLGHTPSHTPYPNLGSNVSMRPLSQISGSRSTCSPNSGIHLNVCLPLTASRGVSFLLMILILLIVSAAYFTIQWMIGWSGDHLSDAVLGVQLQSSDVPLGLLDCLLDLAVHVRIIPLRVCQDHFTVHRLLNSLFQGSSCLFLV